MVLTGSRGKEIREKHIYIYIFNIILLCSYIILISCM